MKTPETNWSEENTMLLTNLLRLPEEHLKSVIQSVYERKPNVFSYGWKKYPEEKPTEQAIYLVRVNGWPRCDLWVIPESGEAYWANIVGGVDCWMPIPEYKP